MIKTTYLFWCADSSFWWKLQTLVYLESSLQTFFLHMQRMQSTESKLWKTCLGVFLDQNAYRPSEHIPIIGIFIINFPKSKKSNIGQRLLNGDICSSLSWFLTHIPLKFCVRITLHPLLAFFSPVTMLRKMKQF